jgi:hypothetical protein
VACSLRVERSTPSRRWSAALAGDNHVDSSEWTNVVILALGAVSVLGAGNLPAGVWRYTKALVSAATAGAVLAQSYLADGITTAEWAQIAVAVLTSVGVLAASGPRVVSADRSGARR